LLALNPKVHNHANLVSTVATKKARAHWKRNQDKECSVSFCNEGLVVINDSPLNGQLYQMHVCLTCMLSVAMLRDTLEYCN